MRVLGVDPGTFRMGVGLVDSDGSRFSLAFSDVLTAKRRDPLPVRLHSLFDQISLLIKQWQPTEVAVEEPFVGLNIRAAMAIGYAQAVAMVAAASYGLTVSRYAPRRVKQSVTDYGGSSKEQVMDMVGVLLSLNTPIASSDAADALAVAVCHINSTHLQRMTITE